MAQHIFSGMEVKLPKIVMIDIKNSNIAKNSSKQNLTVSAYHSQALTLP